MGMSIDKTIDFFNGLECYTPQATDARDVAISTMCKYQKIEEIVKNNNGLFDGTLEHDKAFVKICEVVEDGKID